MHITEVKQDKWSNRPEQIENKKKRYTVKGNILAGKYSCGEIFPRGNILADLEIFFQTRGFFPTRIFPCHRGFLWKPASWSRI